MANPGSTAKIKLGGFVLLIVVVMSGVVWLRHDELQYHRRWQTKVTETALITAIKQYSTDYGYSITGEPAQIFAALRGDNPRKIVFFDAIANRISAHGELIDAWGTPYRFDLSHPDAPRVWSCGPNRQDEGGAEGSDDIASRR